MTDQAEAIDAELSGLGPEDIAVVAPESHGAGTAPHEDVVRAVRYLLYRHELTSGSPQLPQMIAVVSASKGEGVTTVSQALAHVLASERGTRVCWIDVGESGRVPPALGGGSPAQLPGVGTTLREIPSDRSLVKPDPSAIRLVPGKDAPQPQLHRQPGGGPQLDDLIHGLAAEYRHIIFDTPPLLSRIDSIGFLRHAEAYLLVARQGATTLNQITTIADELQSIPSIGAILNDHRSRTPRFLRRFFRE